MVFWPVERVRYFPATRVAHRAFEPKARRDFIFHWLQKVGALQANLGRYAAKFIKRCFFDSTTLRAKLIEDLPAYRKRGKVPS
jgi:hypothetical protein